MPEQKKNSRVFFSLFLMLSAFIPASAGDSSEWHIRVKNTGDLPAGEAVYIAGTFNYWDPGDPDYRLQRNADGSWQIRMELPAGKTEFKFTRGSWDNVETKAKGAMRQNRRIRLHKALHRRQYRITSWQDPALSREIEASISGTVDILPEFAIPQLQRSRRIWIYLPPAYAQSNAHYPVLYMQDGQNCFSQASAFGREWQADETLEKLIRKKKIPALIVVAIDNSQDHRLSEYSPFVYSHEKREVKPEGELYAAFIAQTLKPYIDAHYRTLPGREHNGLLGSSLGGLISLCTLLNYPESFSKAGCMSSSFRLFPGKIQAYIAERPFRYPVRIWMDMGTKESDRDRRKAHQETSARALRESASELRYRVIIGGEHNEESWGRRFGRVLRYLYGGRDVQ
ncbi:MAG: alpha/beta hydrolase-fold protein [Candidatus Marinimicrobia bacterium]|jgi:pullulanase|nr:alpha/beta hydrolase-fold protein [Candidatus Neomarinimicrobiota bacterium]MDD5708985.1 alpha/beta hydrolase-fold protein [Candidatus Neomarinimicrobiota bacterium]